MKTIFAAFLLSVLPAASAEKYLITQVVGMGKGTRTVKVIARAPASTHLTVETYTTTTDDKPKKRTIPAGQTVTFEYSARTDYRVRLMHGERVIAEESSRSKQGL